MILDAVLTFLAIGGLYALLRYIREAAGEGNRPVVPAEPAVIVGAGDAGESLLRELQRNPLVASKVVGFIDDASEKQGHSLRGIPILGRLQDIREIAFEHGVRKAFIAIPSASGAMMRKIVGTFVEAGVAVKVLPPMEKLANSTGFISQLREVSMEDLLRREPVKLDDQAISTFIRDKVVLVTGAAGSIGSELCRQVLAYGPSQLIAVDCAETPLHDLLLRLDSLRKGLTTPELADITDLGRMKEIFSAYSPYVVFHAAALKHVPMLELHPREAFRVNVGGTRSVVEAAIRAKVQAFVLISTDKAVKPSSIMGGTKRVAELLVRESNKRSATRFMSVRFGNVLGSNGSVLRVFESQLDRGGPLTVTHPDMKRYFMTIPEAVQLVLQASVLGKGGETFILDMGQPIRILDLAEDMIRLSGLVPGTDVKIVFSGIRPGEKLNEEISLDSETIQGTPHPQIKELVNTGDVPETGSASVIVEQFELAECTHEQAVELLRRLVPGFEPLGMK